MTGDGAVAEGTFFDDAWYHRWHRRLLDHFVAHAEVDVVWKALPSSNATLDPLPQLLEAAGLSNVRYVTDPFLTVLRDVDAVVTDFPSTGLYEAAHFEKPILAIVFSRFARVRPGARQLFGNVIRDCSDEEAALAAIDEFIEGEPDRWRVPSELILSRP